MQSYLYVPIGWCIISWMITTAHYVDSCLPRESLGFRIISFILCTILSPFVDATNIIMKLLEYLKNIIKFSDFIISILIGLMIYIYVYFECNK